jgi:hypothetical protein
LDIFTHAFLQWITGHGYYDPLQLAFDNKEIVSNGQAINYKKIGAGHEKG